MTAAQRVGVRRAGARCVSHLPSRRNVGGTPLTVREEGSRQPESSWATAAQRVGVRRAAGGA
ncbi:hypothetical protein AAII07_04840 [Microvirga sp. 0TCS3.31]